LRIFSEVQDEFDTNEENFFVKEAAAPSMEFRRLQSPLGLWGIEKTFFLSFNNRYQGTLNTGYYRRQSEAQWALLRNFRLLRWTTFVPKVTLRNRWIDRPQSGEVSEPYSQYVISEGTLRQRFFWWGSMDLSYLLSQRFQENRGSDRGWEEHRLSFVSWFYPNPWVSFRFYTAHNLPRERGEALALLNRQNYDPLRGEISWTPRYNLSFFFREEYTLYETTTNTGALRPLSTQSELIWGEPYRGKDYLSMGTSYLSSNPGVFQVSNAGRINLWSWLQLEIKLRTNVFYQRQNFLNITKRDIFEKEFLTKMEWSCWILTFRLREREEIFEFFFNIELKLEDEQRTKNERVEQNVEFYPWRER
jgi:hypothetical protein